MPILDEPEWTNEYRSTEDLNKYLSSEELVKRFTYHPPKPGQPGVYELLRDKGRHLAVMINQACPPSRETSLALTKLEEAIMWANAAIARRS